MDAEKLAKAANKAVGREHRICLKNEICQMIGLAFIAQWLANQDESILPAASKTAVAAIDLFKATWDC